jgi:hypothetical protein
MLTVRIGARSFRDMVCVMLVLAIAMVGVSRAAMAGTFPGRVLMEQPTGTGGYQVAHRQQAADQSGLRLPKHR